MIGIQAPLKYLQGPGLLDNIGDFTRHIGRKFFVLTSKSVLAKKRDAVAHSFAKMGAEAAFELCGPSVTRAEILRVADLARGFGADCVIGLGGGAVIDTAKAAANSLGLPYVSAPTTASSDAPCSSVSVLYDESGHVAGAEMFPSNPALVIADSAVIAEAPARLLRSGMGDALSTYYEARVCYENGFTNALGFEIPAAAMAIAAECRNILFAHGADAVKLAESKRTGPALERIIEACFWLSGFGFENGGLSAAHAVQDALMRIPECHAASNHGERVAFGVLALLRLTGQTEEYERIKAWNRSVGLPVTLADIGIAEDAESKIRAIVPYAFSKDMPTHMPPEADEAGLLAAIMAGESRI
jgi:glycerol dehydrogenase